tara:strand:+ start:1108 stop:1818 length:711 start_codon:yes stop_codon:yes gene_type:complete
MIFRRLAIFFLSLSVCAAAAEAYLPSRTDSAAFFISSLDLIRLISPDHFRQVNTFLQNSSQNFTGPIFATVLAFPGWFVFGLPGALFVWISFIRGGTEGGKDSARLAELREYEKSLSTFKRLPNGAELRNPPLDQYDLPVSGQENLLSENVRQRTDDLAYLQFMEKNKPRAKDQTDLLSENARQRTDDVTYIRVMETNESDLKDKGDLLSEDTRQRFDDLAYLEIMKNSSKETPDR